MNNIPSIESLHKEKQMKNEHKDKIFDIVLSKCIAQIKDINLKTSYTYTYFEVPNIIIGSPYYDKMGCVKYLMNKLFHKNFRVEFIEPFYLYIDWGTFKNTTNSLDNLEKKAKELLKKYPEVSDISFQIE